MSLNDPTDQVNPVHTSKPPSPQSQAISSSQHSQPQVVVQSSSTQDTQSTRYDRPNDPSMTSQQPTMVRESPVSLPDETRRYYANMQESPLHSPRSLHGFSQGRTASSSPDRRNAIINDKRSESPLKQSHIARFEQGTPDAELSNERSDSRLRSENGEFLDMEGEDTDSHYEESINESGRASAVDSIDPAEYETKDAELGPRRKRATVEDFPLPPTTPPVHLSGGDVFAQQQNQVYAMSASRSQSESMAESADGNRSYHPADGPSNASDFAGQSQASSMYQVPPSPNPVGSQPPRHTSSRTLQLTSSDLQRTTIQVLHSSIRPNDRGKDVLSFVIAVDPGNGRQPWKVEKLYSDVLTLDSRVRAIAGKNLGKRLFSLPEGRLWKDHAPAKVDQRKVSLRVFVCAAGKLKLRT